MIFVNVILLSFIFFLFLSFSYVSRYSDTTNHMFMYIKEIVCTSLHCVCLESLVYSSDISFGPACMPGETASNG